MKNILLVIGLSIAVGACAHNKGGSKKSGSSSKGAPKSSEAAVKIADAKTERSIDCKIDGDTRTLELVTPESGGCAVRYTKFNNTNVAARAMNDMNYCEETYDRIKSRLEDAGFSCD